MTVDGSSKGRTPERYLGKSGFDPPPVSCHPHGVAPTPSLRYRQARSGLATDGREQVTSPPLTGRDRAPAATSPQARGVT